MGKADNVVKDIIERIKGLYHFRTDTEVAQILGLSRSLLYNYKIQGAIPFKALLKLCQGNHISFDWLLTGRGNPQYTFKVETPLSSKEFAYLYGLFRKIETIYAEGTIEERTKALGPIEAVFAGLLKRTESEKSS